MGCTARSDTLFIAPNAAPKLGSSGGYFGRNQKQNIAFGLGWRLEPRHAYIVSDIPGVRQTLVSVPVFEAFAGNSHRSYPLNLYGQRDLSSCKVRRERGATKFLWHLLSSLLNEAIAVKLRG
jgi:hypothetical protein